MFSSNLWGLITLFIFILLGIVTYNRNLMEGFDSNSNNTNAKSNKHCPNLLIQKGSRIYLYNNQLAQVPGVNPIEFDNLEDYTEFLEWQRHQGIRCPVLYLQSSYDTQGNMSYKIHPSVSEPQGGLPPSMAVNNPLIIDGEKIEQQNPLLAPNPTLLTDAGRNDPPYNQNSYPAFDSTDYYVGTTTPLDAMNTNAEMAKVSPNPMDANWGGAAYTQSLVDRGYYKDDEVSIAVP